MSREPLVDVKALELMDYGGRSYRPGEWFKASPVDALTMGQAGKVSLNREYRTRAATAAGVPAEKSAKRYRRRDLTAEPS